MTWLIRSIITLALVCPPLMGIYVGNPILIGVGVVSSLLLFWCGFVLLDIGYTHGHIDNNLDRISSVELYKDCVSINYVDNGRITCSGGRFAADQLLDNHPDKVVDYR